MVDFAAAESVGVAVLAVSATALTLTKSHIFEPLRAVADKWPGLGRGLRCPYCMAHWLGGAAVWALGVSPWPRPWLWAANTMALVMLSALVMGLGIRLLLLGEHELQTLRSDLTATREALESLLNATEAQAQTGGQGAAQDGGAAS